VTELSVAIARSGMPNVLRDLLGQYRNTPLIGVGSNLCVGQYRALCV
jgi:hypothetical protein